MVTYTLEGVADLYRHEADLLLERANRVDVGFTAEVGECAVLLCVRLGRIAFCQDADVTVGRRWTPALASGAALRQVERLIAEADQTTGRQPQQGADRGD